MKDGIIERIEQLKIYLGFSSDGKFADFVHLSRSNYSKMLGGGRTIGDSVINKICIYTNASKKWLTTGEGEMLLNPVNKQEPKTDITKLIELMGKQQEQIMALLADQEEKNKLISDLREQLSRTRS